MTRRVTPRWTTALGGALLVSVAAAQAPTDADLAALTAAELAARLVAGDVSAERVTNVFLERIAALDDSGPKLNAVIEVNPDAIAIARALDARRSRDGPVGPLHGLPVLLKANIDTADRLATTAGSLALANHHAADDAPLVARLRAAGAVIIGKANLSEWANFRSPHSTSGWSSLGGQTRNPYVLDRSPCGSSSGSAVAVAARLVPLAIGTETDGSIVCPAAVNGVVGMKPTLGRVSARGIVPIAQSQDTAGPIARTVGDAALLLRAIEEPDAASGSRAASRNAGAPDSALGGGGLAGVRIGVIRGYGGAGRNPALDAAFDDWLALLRAGGAELVDPVVIAADRRAVGSAELEVLLHEFHMQIDLYLRRAVGPHSLAELVAYNSEHAADVMPFFEQERFIAALQTGDLADASYRDATATLAQFREALAAEFASQRLAAIVAPVASRAWVIDYAAGDKFDVSSSPIAAISGYPSIAVPAAVLNELPVAMAFIGTPSEDERLIGLAAAFESLRGALPPPRFLPTLAE